MIIDGRKLALEKEARLKRDVELLVKSKKAKPLLSSLVAREDEPGLLYTGLKKAAAERMGIGFKKWLYSLKEKRKIYSLLDKIIEKEEFTGLIIQKPEQVLARKFFKSRNEFRAWWQEATAKIPIDKDVDCLNAVNLGSLMMGQIRFYPATVKAIEDILLTIYKEQELIGKEVVILGSSEILGKPLAVILRDRGMTVAICGSSCRDLKSLVKRSEIVIACVGKPKLITAEMVKIGAVVIDAGISRTGKKLVGDVDFNQVVKKAAFITPVPGGVGPLTVISLMESVVQALRK